MPDRNIAAFILTHGRPDHVLTYDVLRSSGYTGPVFLVVDSDDETLPVYRIRFGTDQVIVFDKADWVGRVDVADSLPGTNVVVYAREAVHQIAVGMGLDAFVELDDDYTSFQYRYVAHGVFKGDAVRNMDQLFTAMFDLLDATGALTVAMSQGGDHIGGAHGMFSKVALRRKAMNAFFVNTARPIRFMGRINEDVNAYVVHGSRGALFLTPLTVMLAQKRTQQQTGGLTDAYLDLGTYVKSFYSVMMAPSCVKVRSMGEKHRRYHHSIRWDHAVPKILAPEHRKPRP
jgi:hypothetical protein